MEPMKIANKLLPQGRGLAGALLRRAPSVTLDWGIRQKSRFDCTDDAGHHLGVFLPRGTVVRGGDVLVTEGGDIVRVVASAQAVLRITPCATHGNAFDLTRAAYHLGNRHVPIELHPDHLQIEPDHVLAELLRSMHLTVTEALAAFEPESGAYSATGHGHTEHTHADPVHHHAPAPHTAKVIGIAHVHGPGCKH